jgi:cytochrome c-type biogenesis protein CcmH
MAVLLPLGRVPKNLHAAGQARRVYLDQLNELERDRSEGRLRPEEAEAARVEIARRLLAADSAPSNPSLSEGSVAARRAISLVALIGIPAVSLALYLGLGAPTLPGQPLAARLAAPAAPNEVDALVARVEAHLTAAPDDGRGWEVIAPVYLETGRADDSVRAYQNAIRLLGSNATRQAGLGEAIVAAEGGIVTADARTAFEAANAADPTAPGPRFYLALAAQQEGDLGAAAEGWRALLAESQADAPWRASVEQALASIEQPDGPSAEQMAAAEDLSPADRTAMIEGMVEGLAERLQREPNDVEGWLRLIRSYVVLDRPTDAAEAARAALAGINAREERARVEALIAELGVTPTGASVQ